MSHSQTGFSDVFNDSFNENYHENSLTICNTIQISNPSSAASSVPNSDEEDEDIVEKKQSSKERRREAHTQAEKKRRESIRKGYSELQMLVENGFRDTLGGSQKLSKTAILQMSLDHIEQLEQNNNKQLEELERLRREKEALKIMKESYEQIVLQHQTSIGNRVGFVSDEMKFQLFTQIMEKFFQTFNQDVSATSFKKLSCKD